MNKAHDSILLIQDGQIPSASMIVRSILKPVARATSCNAFRADEDNSSATALHNLQIINAGVWAWLVSAHAMKAFNRSILWAKPFATRKSKARYAIGGCDPNPSSRSLSNIA
jgi:hypothetical protein